MLVLMAKSGPDHYKWKGGHYQNGRDDYVYLLRPDHPNADKRGYVREHVYVMSTVLGRPIKKSEVVHHINGVRDDNRPENLVVTIQSLHCAGHHKGIKNPRKGASLRALTSEQRAANNTKAWSGKRAAQLKRNKPRCAGGEGCIRVAYAHGLCFMHYKRRWRSLRRTQRDH
jgi:hypothetical protein